jgi:hemerythrin
MSLVWSEKFATGIESVDRQHEKLFSSVNTLEGLIASEVFEGPEVDRLLDFLSEYVSLHFNHEEYCMELTHCPAAEQNKKAHEEFLRYYSDFKKQYKISGHNERQVLLGKLEQAMEKWLSGHICKVDIQLRNLRQQSGTVPAQHITVN